MSEQRLNTFILVALFLLIGFVFFHVFFEAKLSNFSYELMAAVLGTAFTVAVMAVILKWQYKEEQKSEYAVHVFRAKLKIYQELLKLIFEMDDDKIIEDKEITIIENKIGEACLVANASLVSMLSQFLLQLKMYGRLYPRDMDEEQIAHFVKYFRENKERLAFNKRVADSEPLNEKNFSKFFVTLDEIVQGMREDLAVVEGDVRELIEHFVDMPFDSYGLIKKPNIVS
ncbi:hypothetical protein [Phorcysia thermohydrogeniphila]|uniref:Uncharacterized protein n=1 Tax=Phorcysia thermohydrogeniphila TaxID=936138 RepID=A0A4R1GE57_9BACT|nr:hypothetical protein [Phorcysia thermohydrogeniphila]TCK02492.1 hypothetical protein CLV27_1667 [Phorcysia thermohydrogeniphila]